MACSGRFVRAYRLLLLGPGMGQPGHERRRCDPGRSGAIDNRSDDARRHESEPREMADVAFGFSFAIGNVGETLATLDVLDPFARLGDGDQQGFAASRLHRGVMRWHMDDALDGTAAGTVQGMVTFVGAAVGLPAGGRSPGPDGSLSAICWRRCSV